MIVGGIILLLAGVLVQWLASDERMDKLGLIVAVLGVVLIAIAVLSAIFDGDSADLELIALPGLLKLRRASLVD